MVLLQLYFPVLVLVLCEELQWLHAQSQFSPVATTARANTRTVKACQESHLQITVVVCYRSGHTADIQRSLATTLRHGGLQKLKYFSLFVLATGQGRGQHGDVELGNCSGKRILISCRNTVFFLCFFLVIVLRKIAILSASLPHCADCNGQERVFIFGQNIANGVLLNRGRSSRARARAGAGTRGAVVTDTLGGACLVSGVVDRRRGLGGGLRDAH